MSESFEKILTENNRIFNCEQEKSKLENLNMWLKN